MNRITSELIGFSTWTGASVRHYTGGIGIA